MIEIKNLIKGYERGKPVLSNLSVTIADATIFGLVGINGAGKSTLLRVLASVMKADGGQVCVDGENVYENERIKRNMFFLPDEPFYTANVTAEGLADMYRAVYDLDIKVFRERLKSFSLDPKKPIRNFSKGMKRQVFVALALSIAPKYLLLDEAFDGLDPLARLTFKKCIVELVEEKGTTVIISSHSLRELEDICDSYGILDHGTITCSGELASDLGKVHKFQAAFHGEVEAEELGFACMAFEQTGKVVRFITKAATEEVLQKLARLDPIFVEEIEVDFEEMFIGEVQARGYLQ
jgi:ABC-2 type transport system ATP-binding protein